MTMTPSLTRWPEHTWRPLHHTDPSAAPTLVVEDLVLPFTLGRGSRVLVDPAEDLFARDVHADDRMACLDVMRAAPWNVYVVTTTRLGRMLGLVKGPLRRYGRCTNIWFAAVAGPGERVAAGLRQLRALPAERRCLVVEPTADLGEFVVHGIDWLVVAGSSGPEFLEAPAAEAHGLVIRTPDGWAPRPECIDRVRELRDRCLAARVPFRLDHWGGPEPMSAGRELDGRTWDDRPLHAWPAVPDAEERRRRLDAFLQRHGLELPEPTGTEAGVRR